MGLGRRGYVNVRRASGRFRGILQLLLLTNRASSTCKTLRGLRVEKTQKLP